MPIYAYVPANNNHSENGCCNFEALQSISEPELSRCPTCDNEVVRVFAPFGIGATHSHANSSPASSCTQSCGGSHQPHSHSAAGRIAQLASGHVCSAGCRHNSPHKND